MPEAFICDYVRTPIGRFGGQLASVRTDDLGAVPLRALMERTPVWTGRRSTMSFIGCANQAGEDNRNVARMALLLAGLPKEVSGLARSIASAVRGMDAVTIAARAIKAGEAELMIAGGVEVMTPRAVRAAARPTAPSRATPRSTTPRSAGVSSTGYEDSSTASTRCPRPARTLPRNSPFPAPIRMLSPRAASRAAAAQENGRLAKEIVPVTIPQRKGDPAVVSRDEHPRDTTHRGAGQAADADSRRAAR